MLKGREAAEMPGEPLNVRDRDVLVEEQAILDALFLVVYPLALAGDEAAIDRVLKILELKRKYRHDRVIEGMD